MGDYFEPLDVNLKLRPYCDEVSTSLLAMDHLAGVRMRSQLHAAPESGLKEAFMSLGKKIVKQLYRVVQNSQSLQIPGAIPFSCSLGLTDSKMLKIIKIEQCLNLPRSTLSLCSKFTLKLVASHFDFNFGVLNVTFLEFNLTHWIEENL